MAAAAATADPQQKLTLKISKLQRQLSGARLHLERCSGADDAVKRTLMLKNIQSKEEELALLESGGGESAGKQKPADTSAGLDQAVEPADGDAGEGGGWLCCGRCAAARKRQAKLKGSGTRDRVASNYDIVEP